MRNAYLVLVVAAMGLFLATSSVSAEVVNWNETDYMAAIFNNKVDATAIEKKYGKEALSYCSCLVSFRYIGGPTGLISVEGYDQKEILKFYSKATDAEFLKASVYIGAKPYRIAYSVDFDKGICNMNVEDGSVKKISDVFSVDSCTSKVRKSCCCDEDKGKYSTKYSNCGRVTTNLDNVGGACMGRTFTYDSDADLCKTYEGRVEPLAGVTQPTGDNPEVKLSIDTLKKQAEGLNQLGITDPNALIGRVIKGLTMFIGMILFILYIYAGLLWMLASGNDEQITKAKNILVWATLGVAVMLSSYVVVQFIFTNLKL